MTADTIPARLLAQARQRPDAPAYCAKVDGAWRATRWKLTTRRRYGARRRPPRARRGETRRVAIPGTTGPSGW